jgi:Na+-transporting methylmalonyl-CoA/oxaloacetate decarboxylase gamma subunit
VCWLGEKTVAFAFGILLVLIITILGIVENNFLKTRRSAQKRKALQTK